jgi:hypothetical protein
VIPASVIDDREPSPPVTLGPYTIEYLGQRMARRVLRIRVGQHVLDLFATLDGRAAHLTAELDGRRLVKRHRAPRPGRRWSNDPDVKRWVIAAASETDDGQPRWTCKEIAQNLKRARRGEMSGQAVLMLIWRLAPELAQRRALYWKTHKRGKKNPESPETRAANRKAIIAEYRRAGLL